MMRSKRLILTIVVCLVAVVGVWTAGPATVHGQSLPGEGQTLTLGYAMWTADNPALYVSKVLLEDELGYNIDIAELGVPALWAALGSGQVHAFTNAWFPNQQYLLDSYEDSIELVSLHYDNSFSATVIPTWVAEEYDVWTKEDLFRPEVIELFDRDGDGKGDFLGCDVNWTCHDYTEDKLVEYGLDEHYNHIGIAEQMVNFQVIQAMRNREPIIFLSWSPNWLFSVYPVDQELTLLTDPWGYHSDPQGGEIDEYGWPPGIAKTAVHISVKEDHPEAYALLSQISVPIEDQNDSMYLQVEQGEGSPRDLQRHAHEWVEANQEKVDGWLEAAGLR